MRKCCVPGCANRNNLHAVPYTRSARHWKAWLTICPFLSKYTFKQLEYVKICKSHFLPQHFNEKRKLNSNAIPSLNLPNQCLQETIILPITQKKLEITPMILGQPLDVKVVDFIPTGSSQTDKMVFTSTNVVPPLTTNPTLSVYNEPVVQPTKNLVEYTQPLSSDPSNFSIEIENSLDSFQEQIICSHPVLEPPKESSQLISSDPSTDMCHITHCTHNTSHEQSLVFDCTNVEAPLTSASTPILSSHNKSVLEPTVNITQYSEPLSPDPIKPSAGASRSLSPNPATMPSNTKSYSLQGQTTPVKSRSSRIHSHRDIIPRVRLNKNENSPRKRKLRQGNKILKAKLKSMTQKYNRLKSKLQTNKVNNFINKYPLLSKFGKLLIDSQLRLSGVKVRALRYTNDEKIFALSLYKLSPKCYKFFQKCIRLPSKSTINSILKDIAVRPGINDFILQHLADVAKYKDAMGLQCVLLFDEMAIKKNLFFNFQTGVIEGFEDLGGGARTNNVADKVLVFMLRGIFSPWKIPIAFYFVRDGIKTFSLKNILKETIELINNAGFHLRSTVSDQGSANVAAINSLISDARKDLLRSGNDGSNVNYYIINGKKIYHIYDVPHLLKCYRNNFQKKDVLIGNQRAQWVYIERLYALDGRYGAARNTKLTDKHVKPNSYDKMKASNDNIIPISIQFLSLWLAAVPVGYN